MKKPIVAGISMIVLVMLFLTGCADKPQMHQLYKMSVAAPADMEVEVDEKSEEGYLPSKTVVLTLDDTDGDGWPEALFHMQVFEMEMTEERYADQLNGMDVNTYFQNEEGVVDRIVEGNRRGSGGAKDVTSSIRDMGHGITALQVDFIDVDCGGMDRHRRVMEFYYEGNEYYVLAYWTPEQTKRIEQIFDSLTLT